MKDFIKFLFGVLGLTALALGIGYCLTVLNDDSVEEQFTRAISKGPFPEELPAGYTLITDGTSFDTTRPREKYEWYDRRVAGNPSAYGTGTSDKTACEAVQWAWNLREFRRERARWPKADNPPEPEKPWTVVTKPDTGNWCDTSAK